MKLLVFFPFLLCSLIGNAQNIQAVARLRQQLANAEQDTSQIRIMIALCDNYRSTDSARFFGQQALALARKINNPEGEIRAMSYLGRTYAELGNLPMGFQIELKALQIAEEKGLEKASALTYNQMGNLYTYLNDFAKALRYYKRSLAIYKKYSDKLGAQTEKMQVGRAFEENNQLDSALYYEQQAYDEMRQYNNTNALIYRNMARIYNKAGNHALALNYAHSALRVARQINFRFGYAFIATDLGRFFQQLNQRDSSIYYSQLGLQEAQLISNQRIVIFASKQLSELYEPIDTKEAFRYYKMAIAAQDSLFGGGSLQAIQQLFAQEQQRKKDAENARIAYQNQLKQYALLAGLGVFFLVAFILYRNNKQQKQANYSLHKQKEEIDIQRTKAEKALSELKATQDQLIQREKMASLGELTAGIAHEIQNPLNFVNNFSEVSAELMTELTEELDKGDTNEAKAIAEDVRQNLQKITQHGGRASSIVKGMLEHSRTATGQKEPTDLNALADEYLRLAYQGLRAKDKTFNVDLVTDFDPDLALIDVVPQEIGRVLLNLFNNAFYAVREKQKTAPVDYQPTVWVSTERQNEQVEIRVKDNGVGIPDAVKAKIFQPFFTTKPTGEGTGLGLSLSYDIITKGHRGQLSVNTQAGQFTEFIVTLPLA